MDTRRQTIDEPLDRTCQWLLESQTYTVWRDGRDMDKHHGLLWIKGKPGSGKSTLMKEAFRCAEQEKTDGSPYVAAFFFNARGGELERNSLGLFQSLIYQLLRQAPHQLADFVQLYQKKENDQGPQVKWHVGELKSLFQSLFTKSQIGRTIIFVDALDECKDEGTTRDLAFFFRSVTTSAYAASREHSVCISSRHFPSVTVGLCPEIFVERFNGPDIARYVQERFVASDLGSENQWAYLEAAIVERSSGVFLWVVLVVNILLKDRDEGKNMKFLENRISQVPPALEILFAQLLGDLRPEESQITIRLFQWVLLSARTLRLREWRAARKADPKHLQGPS
jgi:hypothetical protein